VDHEGEVLEVFATKRRDRWAALKFLKRAMISRKTLRQFRGEAMRTWQAATAAA
jgi:putative transposase